MLRRLTLSFRSDLPPLKWSSLKYGLALEDEINGEETAYSNRGLGKIKVALPAALEPSIASRE